MAKSEDLAWAAGLFDGEGTIALYYSKNGTSTHWKCYLRVCMIDEGCIRRFHKIVGEGTVTRRKKPDYSRGALWAWKASSLHADRVLDALLPYLIGKATQAELFREFRRLPNAKTAFDRDNPLKFEIALKVKQDKQVA